MKFLIRCDANLDIGMGHMMRCLALAQALKDSGQQAVFVMSSMTNGLRKRFIEEDIEVFQIDAEIGSEKDAQKLSEIAKKVDAIWVITDGYKFRTKYQIILKDAGIKLMAIDDVADYEYVSDIILNQNPGFKVEDYSLMNKNSVLLLGPKYSLLRREFRKYDFSSINSSEKNVLVTMGGADPCDLTSKIVDVLSDFEGIKVTILIGAANPNVRKFKSQKKTLVPSIKVIIDPESVVSCMTRASLAIHAAGSTSWELAYLGIPSICYVLAENQRPIASALEVEGYSRNMGWYEQFSEKELELEIHNLLENSHKLEQMSKAGRTIVDGQGTQRVIKELIK